MENNIDTTPNPELKSKTTHPNAKGIAVLGIMFQLPVVIGLMYFINGMILIFQSITPSGLGDPKAIASAISSALVFTLLGCIIAIPGLLLTLFVLFFTKYRSKMLFIFNITASVFWILSFPWGTVFGVIYLSVTLIKREKLQKKESQQIK